MDKKLDKSIRELVESNKLAEIKASENSKSIEKEIPKALEGKFTSVEGKIRETSTSLEGKISEISTSLEGKISSVEGKISEISTSLEDKMNDLNQKLGVILNLISK